MSKSRARLLAELLNASGRVKKDKSDLAGADSIIDLDTLPTITNAKLENSSISIAGHSTALGGSVSLNTGDITEHTDYKYYTDARVRAAISVDGSLSYNSSTGVLSYTTPTTIASLSNHDTADLAEGTNLYYTDARARGAISVSGNALSYNSSTGVISSSYEESPSFTGTVNIGGGTSYFSEKLLVNGRTRVAGQFDISLGTGYGNYGKFTHNDSQLEIATARSAGTAGHIVLAPLGTAALTLNASGAATFTGTISSGAITSSGSVTSTYFLASGADTTPAGTTFANAFNGSTRVAYFDGDTTVSTWYGSGNTPYAAIDAVNGELRLYVNDTSGNWHQKINMTSTGVTHYGTVTSSGVSNKIDSSTYAYFEADGTTNQWKWLRLSTNGTTNWDIATKNDDLSGALQFRIGGGATNRTYMDTSGNWVMQGSVEVNSHELRVTSSNAYHTHLNYQNSGQNYISQATSGGLTQFRNSNGSLMEIAASGNVTIANDLTVSGNLTISGTTTTLNTATLQVEDKNIVLNYGTGDTSGSADGAGITIQDAVNSTTDAAMTWNASSDLFNFSHKINVQGDVQAYNFYGQDYHVLNSAGTAWHEWATRASNRVNLNINSLETYGASYLTGGSSTTPAVHIKSSGNSWSEGLAIHPIADSGYALTFFRTKSSYTDQTNTWAIGNLGGSGYQNYFGLLRKGLTGGVADRTSDAPFTVSPSGTFKFGFNPYVGSNKIWHAGNDGSSSGLDADTVDGVQASNIVYGSSTRKTNNSNPNSAINSGFYDVYQTNAPTSTWYSYITMAHTNASNQHGHQIAGSFYSDGELYNRHYDGTTASFGNWTKIWNAANDGSGSGLDADYLDGIQGSQFLRSDATDVATGKITLQYGETSDLNSVGGSRGVTAFHTANVGQTSNRPDSGNYATGLEFTYFDSNARSQLAAGSGGSNNTAAFYVRSEAWGSTNSWTSWYKLFHTGNDGSGSGLDADTVDGYDVATTGANKILRTDGNNYIQLANWINIGSTGLYSSTLGNHFHVDTEGYIARSGSTTESRFRLQTSNATTRGVLYSNSSNQVGFLNPSNYWRLQVPSSGDIFWHNGSGGTGAKIWHASNDGSGSGLDADFLDGIQGSQFLRSDAADTGAPSTATALTLGYIVNNNIIIGNGTTSFADTYDNSPWYGIGRTNLVGWNSGQHKAQMAFYWGLVLRSGQSRIELGPASNGPIQFGDGGTTNWAKINSTGIYQGTSNLVWHAGNDGSGSGLDADLLDGINSSSFLRSDASDTMNGELNVTHNGGVTGTSAPTYTQANIELQTSNNNVPGISFHRGGYSATTLYEYDGELYVNAWVSRNQTGKLVSFGNDGSGSGLDADTVDGIQGSQFLRSDAGDTATGSIVFSGATQYFRKNNATNYTNGSLIVESYGGSSSIAAMGFHISGQLGRMLSMNSAGTLNWEDDISISGSFLTPSTSGNGLKSANGANHIFPLDAYNNMHIRSTTGSEYHDSTAYYFRTVAQSNLVTITSSNTNIAAGTLTRAGNTVWDAGNDGAGSGLDADTVDSYGFINHEGVVPYQAFLVYGDTDKYYPVVITGGPGHSSDFKIWRGYNEHGPNDWNTSTHKGGLTFRYRISGSAGWGGYPTRIKVLEAEEIYSTLLGGINYTAHTMKHVVWLRGGGTNGARYHISSPSIFSLAIYTDTSSGYTSGSGWLSYGHSNTSYNTYVDYRTLTQRNAAMEGEIYNTMSVNYGDGKVRHVLGGTGPAKTYFTTSNDGSGSGFDADLLDGQHGSYYATASSVPTNNNQLTNGAGYQTTSGNVRTLNSYQGSADSNSLQYWQASGQNSDYAPDGSWYTTIRGGHGNPQTYYSNTLAMKMTGSGVGTIYTQNLGNGTFQGWNKHWHDRNDGSGSGLDADTLDGLNSTRFSRYGQIYNSSTDWNTIFSNTGQTNQVWHEIHNGTSWTNAPGTSAYSYGGLFNLYLSSMQFQWYIPHTASNNNGMWYRTNWGGNSWYAWARIWDSRNDGSGSALDADTVDGIHGASFLRSDADDTASGQYSFSKTNDHAIEVGTIRGRAVGSRTGDYIHMYERVHIGYPSGWGGQDAPSYGLSTYGTCELATTNGRTVIIGGTSSNNAYNTVSTTRLLFGGGNDPSNYHIGTNMENYGGNYTKLDLRWHTGIRMGAQQSYGGIRFFDSEDLGTVLFSIGKGDNKTRVETGDFIVAAGEINCGAPYVGNMQNGAVNIGRTDTNYAWSGTTWASDIRAGFMANCSETWEFVVHDSGDSVDSFMKYNGTDFEMGNNIGWGTTTFTFASHITAGGNVTAYSDIKLKENIEVIPNALDKVNQIRGVTFTRNDQENKDVRHAGVIAQEVEKVLPEVVGYDENKDIKTVSYGNMVGLLIEAVKELKQEVDDLKAQLKEK